MSIFTDARKRDFEIIGKATGLSHAEVMKQWELAKANNKLLTACAGPHYFVREDDTRYFCSRCGGKVTRTNWIWYQKGLEHGQKHSSAHCSEET